MNSSHVTFQLVEQPFDSGTIASKVGELRIDPSISIEEKDGLFIADEARVQKYDLISFKATSLQKITGFRLVGIVEIFEGLFQEVFENVKVPCRFLVRPLEEKDWEVIERLLPYGSATRFTLDPAIGSDCALRHKLRILKTLSQQYPGSLLTAMDANKKVIGYQISYPEGDRLLFYDILVAPAFRNGFVALNLLAANMVHALKIVPAISKISTRLYSHNEDSKKLFSSLRLKQTQKEYYYHLWL